MFAFEDNSRNFFGRGSSKFWELQSKTPRETGSPKTAEEFSCSRFLGRTKPQPKQDTTSKTSRMKQVDPKPGDLIEIFRLGYQHWAVYVGSGYVVHLTQPNGKSSCSFMSVFSPSAVVKKEPLSVVAGTDRYHVNKHDSKWPVRHREEIVSMAEKLVGRTVKYKLFRFNCEHFACSLRYPVSWSDQACWVYNGIVAAPLFFFLL